jgi:hypothetical protein
MRNSFRIVVSSLLFVAMLVLPAVSNANSLEAIGDVVIDHATGITWYRNLADFANKTYQQQYDAIQALNSANFNNRTSWHMATEEEMYSLAGALQDRAPGSFSQIFYPTPKVNLSDPLADICPEVVDDFLTGEQDYNWLGRYHLGFLSPRNVFGISEWQGSNLIDFAFPLFDTYAHPSVGAWVCVGPSGLVAAFGTEGSWLYHDGTWSQLSGLSPNRMVSYGTKLAANFPGYGLYQYDGTTWTQFTPNSGVEDLVGNSDRLFADLGSIGLWQYDGAWTQLSSVNPDRIAANGNSLLAAFSGYGLFQYEGTTWTQLTSVGTVDNLLAIAGTIYVDFGTLGLWRYDVGWTNLSSANPNKIQAYNGKLVANFPGYGLYEYNGSAWTQLTSNDSVQDLLGISTNLYADYGALGLYRYNGAWTQVSPSDPNRLGSYGEKLVANFPENGPYEFDGTTWILLTANTGGTDMVGVDLPVESEGPIE